MVEDDDGNSDNGDYDEKEKAKHGFDDDINVEDGVDDDDTNNYSEERHFE